MLKALIGLKGRPNQASAGGSSGEVRDTIALCHALLGERGEVSGGRLAAEALRACRSLLGADLDTFFDLLVKEFSPDPEEVVARAEAYRADPCARNLTRLFRVVEPPRQELFRRLNMAPDGTRTLLAMRRRLLRELGRHPEWEAIENDLAHLLASWFNRGFLVLRRIDWRTPAIILEKLIEYEAVHEIAGWRDLRRRLEADRRCYAFFHPALQDEPIIFVEVALSRGISTQVQSLLDPTSPVLDPRTANCAVFYSITNCQEGLRGVSFGNFLIKKVAEDIGREMPQIRTFATVSPVPRFREWLEQTVRAHAAEPKWRSLVELVPQLEGADWLLQDKVVEAARRLLPPLCAYYLLYARQENEPLDSVARFHLRNGARLERINWAGDTSVTGLQRSAGLMVNYVYQLADVERNHERYIKRYKIAASPAIEILAKKSPFLSNHEP